MESGLWDISASFSLGHLHWWNKCAKCAGINRISLPLQTVTQLSGGRNGLGNISSGHNGGFQTMWGHFDLTEMCKYTAYLSTILERFSSIFFSPQKSTVFYSSDAVSTVFFLHLVHYHKVYQLRLWVFGIR